MIKIKATPNHKKRTFTIRDYDYDGTLVKKYRTLPMTKQEFEECLYNTPFDWAYYLRREEVIVLK